MSYITTKELAELLCTNPSVIRASRVSGMLFNYPAPLHIKLGGKVLYRASEIRKYEASLVQQRITD